MTEPILWADAALLLATGAVAGLVGAIVGLGGGVIVVPILHLGFGVSLPTAVGTSLVVITGTSLVATAGYLERGLVLERVGLELQLGAMMGAVGAAWAAPRVPTRVVALVFAVAMVWAAILLWWRREAGDGSAEPKAGARRALAWALAPVGGGAAGLIGIGGGLVQVPILRLVLDLEIRRAVATSTLLVGLTAPLAAVFYLRRDAVDLPMLPWLLAGILAGGALAPRASDRLPRRAIEIGFSLAALYGAYRMASG